MERIEQPITGSEAWRPPGYVDPDSFDERDVTLDGGPFAVPGTVTVPRTPGPHPAVVLLAGGGPFNRDETAGPNKTLKDIAWGLAARGIVVLRFDKATFVDQGVFGRPDFTPTDEYVPHAVAAVELLQRHEKVDTARVFVVGHSMGGKFAPRVAATAPSVAGLVVMAGDTQPMHVACVRVMRYLVSLDPENEEAARLLATFTEQAKVVDSPELSVTTPPSELPFGASGAYWLDLRAYDPVATAVQVAKPMFIVQGGRDYQITVADDLIGWQRGLADRPDVTIRIYDALNHMLCPGTGPSTPADYEAVGHVDPELVTDVANWILAR
ncbi:alpha/beta hydrolase family protein [Nocardia mexicana]|uniref:AB hydrolase-1 domain-containing protein n=1 Tax=Nocardia mexicana TaxID=279262 RepID=A0A370HBL8_9NOCA|nr:alpha/beta fold hydrolase [Nocardia mexicana]RDI54336.1 hypothetical protein DFR68_102461 [Nocardia mexicana]